jgi:hypothetical protein
MPGSAPGRKVREPKHTPQAGKTPGPTATPMRTPMAAFRSATAPGSLERLTGSAFPQTASRGLPFPERHYILSPGKSSLFLLLNPGKLYQPTKVEAAACLSDGSPLRGGDDINPTYRPCVTDRAPLLCRNAGVIYILIFEIRRSCTDVRPLFCVWRGMNNQQMCKTVCKREVFSISPPAAVFLPSGNFR